MNLKGKFDEYTPTRGFALILALGLVMFGVWLLNPYIVTFDAPIYAGLSGLGTEYLWGSIFFVSGGILLIGVILRNLTMVAVGSFLGWLLWTATSVLYGVADPTSTPVVSVFLLALMHAWIYLQTRIHPLVINGEFTEAAREYKIKEVKRKGKEELDQTNE